MLSLSQSRSRRRRAALLVLACSAISPTALAQPPDAPADTPLSHETPTPTEPTRAKAALAPDSPAAQVKALWARGNKAWDEGRYADAIVDYEEAATISQRPKAFYNLAASYERVGRKADALTWLERFRASASREELEQAPNLGKRIAILRNQVAVLKVNVNVVGARVLVRNTVVGTKPADRPLEVALNEGRATIEISNEGYQPYQKEHTLRGGSVLEIEVQLNQKAPSTIVLEKTNTVYLPSKPLWSRWWFWAGAGVLAAGGATAIVALSTDKATTKGDTTIITSLPSKFNVRF